MFLIVALPLSQPLAGRMLPSRSEYWIMIRLKHRRAPATKEKNCPACEGAGVAEVKKLVVPGHRVYSPRCEECGGRGRITIDDA
jgi:DnaJ-class molecular chaperone